MSDFLFFGRLWEIIVTLINGLTSTIGGAIDELVPEPSPEVLGACQELRNFVSSSSWASELVPTGAIAAAAVMVAAAIAATVAIRVLRIGVSVKSGGGGA